MTDPPNHSLTKASWIKGSASRFAVKRRQIVNRVIDDPSRQLSERHGRPRQHDRRQASAFAISRTQAIAG